MVPEAEEIARLAIREDDRATLDLLGEYLTADRYGVFAAPTASDALRLCQYGSPELLLAHARNVAARECERRTL